MDRVMVRVPQLGKDTLLVPADVISRRGDTLRVRIPGRTGVLTVEASATMPLAQGYGRPVDGVGSQAQPARQFPESMGALANRL